MGKILSIHGTHDENTLAQLKDVNERAEYTALMADGHLGYIMPVGGVAAYDNKVSVAGVGYDIGCGNCAIKTNSKLKEFKGDFAAIADLIQEVISFGIGRKNMLSDSPIDNKLFDDDAWKIIPEPYQSQLKKKAEEQIGTVGAGNHYVDILVSEDDSIWVADHFGSRGFGWTIASWFMALAAGKGWGEKVKEHEALLDLDTPLGQDYWELMQLAGKYAYLGREWVCKKVIDIFSFPTNVIVHNNHNFAWVEEHFGRDLVVVRKGCTPAFEGQYGFVGGSMGDVSLILRGSNEFDIDIINEQQECLFSTIHGAGRIMSRTEAKGKINRKTNEIKKEGKVTKEMMYDWIGEMGVILRGGDVDESPHVYRNLKDVVDAQGKTVDVVNILHPVVVVMAGEGEYDPYKD